MTWPELRGTVCRFQVMFFQNVNQVASVTVPDFSGFRSTSTGTHPRQFSAQSRISIHCPHQFASAWYSAEDMFTFLPVCSTRQLMCFSVFRRRSLRVRRRVGVQDIQIQLRAPLTNLDSEPKNAAWLPSINRFDTIGRDGRRSCCNDTAVRNGHT